jgi:hypothetical protein
MPAKLSIIMAHNSLSVNEKLDSPNPIPTIRAVAPRSEISPSQRFERLRFAGVD